MECKQNTLSESLIQPVNNKTKDTDMLYASRSLALLKRKYRNLVTGRNLNPPDSTNMSALTCGTNEGVPKRRKRRFEQNEPGVLTNRNGRVTTPFPEDSTSEKNKEPAPVLCGTQSPCSMTDPPTSSSKYYPPTSPPASPSSSVSDPSPPPSSPCSEQSTPTSPVLTSNSAPSIPTLVPSSPTSLAEGHPPSESCKPIGDILCKSCERVLKRPSSCCGTYSVALSIRVEDIPETYRPPVKTNGSIRAHFPSFSKAKRYRSFLSNQVGKERRIKFMVHYDPKKNMLLDDKRQRLEQNAMQIRDPASYKSPMLLAARNPNSSEALIRAPIQLHPAAASFALSEVFPNIASNIASNANMPNYNIYKGAS